MCRSYPNSNPNPNSTCMIAIVSFKTKKEIRTVTISFNPPITPMVRQLVMWHKCISTKTIPNTTIPPHFIWGGVRKIEDRLLVISAVLVYKQKRGCDTALTKKSIDNSNIGSSIASVDILFETNKGANGLVHYQCIKQCCVPTGYFITFDVYKKKAIIDMKRKITSCVFNKCSITWTRLEYTNQSQS